MAYGNAPSVRGYSRIATITNSDTVNLAVASDAILVLTAGALSLQDEAGTAATIVTAIAGTVLPLKVVRINATGSAGTAAALFYI
jgi:hypothetical protein